MIKKPRTWMLLAFALIALATPPLAAQDTIELSPTQLNYNEEGVKLLGDGDYEGALNKFRSSLRLSEANVTYLNMGRTFQKMGECKDAKEAYEKADAAPKVAQPTPQEITKVLESYRSELPDTCPTRLKLACTPPSMTIQIDDGESMPCPAQPIEIEPGDHTVTATAFDQSKKESFSAAEGDTIELEFVIEKQLDEGVAANEGTSVSAEEPFSPPQKSSNVWALSLMGVGVAGLATGLIFDLAILGPAIDDGENAASKDDHEEFEATYDRFRVPTLIAYGVGAAAITGGLIWWLVSDSGESASVSAAPTRDGWAISYGTKF